MGREAIEILEREDRNQSKKHEASKNKKRNSPQAAADWMTFRLMRLAMWTREGCGGTPHACTDSVTPVQRRARNRPSLRKIQLHFCNKQQFEASYKQCWQQKVANTCNGLHHLVLSVKITKRHLNHPVWSPYEEKEFCTQSAKPDLTLKFIRVLLRSPFIC